MVISKSSVNILNVISSVQNELVSIVKDKDVAVAIS